MKTAELPKATSLKSLTGLGVIAAWNKVYLYYRSKSDPPDTFYTAISDDGFSFAKQKKSVSVKTGTYTKADIKTCRNFSISQQDKYFTCTYVRKIAKGSVLEQAYSSDLLSFEYEGNIANIENQGFIVPNYHFQDQLVLYYVQKTIQVAYSTDYIHWEKTNKDLLSAENGEIHNIGCVVPTEKGLLMIYHTKNDNGYAAHIALFDANDPTHMLWNPEEPIWIQPKTWKKTAYPLGVVLFCGMFLSYWHIEGEGIFVFVYALHKISDGDRSKDISLCLNRSEENPIIVPKSRNSWEAFNTFNPAAIYEDGKVHILYRAQGHDYVSVIGYATSGDGIHIKERLDQPIYSPRESFEWVGTTKPSEISYKYVSGGGYGGCEDPRITKINNRFYLTYVAFDGINPPRIALTSITSEDFLTRRWLWERPVLISPPGVVDKSAVIFPEKINGKYVIMHRIYPDILIDFVDSLEFDGTHWLNGQYKISPRPDKWDSRKIGAGAPPIKTKYGWLLLYQSVGEQDSGRYKIGAMLLDIKDPTKVLYRSQSPILEPEASYENNGFKQGVIYPCGAVVIGKTLYMYYGGADSYVCVATANIDKFLDELKFSQLARLTTPIAERIKL
ncbi:MAG: hypothetical protein M1277_01090 [Patescibacteria group bacterium]|nr:hypothetical protein [Patescibacteria group bacterium]